MNKFTFIFVVLLLGVGLFGCQSVEPSQSTLKANFSLDAIVEANQEYLLDEARILSGAEVGSADQFTQRHETVTLRIEPPNAPALMEAVRSGIEQALLESDARIVGSVFDGSEHFSLTYEESGAHGTILVWGVPGAEANYTLIMLITEN